MPTKRSNFEQVRSWLNEINKSKEKRASANKSSAAHSEPGGYMGATTHPSKDVNDNLEDVSTGARAAENEKDIKEMEMAGNIDETKENPGKKQEDLNYDVGVHQSGTGEDPSVEDDYKDRPKDPGTTHPANTNDEGKKYGSWNKKESFEISKIANEILADIATEGGIGKTNQPAKKSAADTTTKTPSTPVANTDAVQAGYELANLFGMSKEAADTTSQQVVAHMIKSAEEGAHRVGSYLVSFIKESGGLTKLAEPEMPPPGGGEEEGAGGPPMPPGGPGGEPPVDGAGGPPMPPGGDAPMAPPGGGEGGGGDKGQALQELAMALMELGISPEELMAAIGGGGGAGGGAGGPPMPPGGGGGGDPMAALGGAGGPGGGEMPPPTPGSPAEAGAKIASAVKEYKRSGRFCVSEAKTAAQRNQRDEMKRYVMEILGATR